MPKPKHTILQSSEETPMSLSRALQIYNTIASPERYQTLAFLYEQDSPKVRNYSEIVRFFNMPKSTVTLYLNEFEELGLIRRERSRGGARTINAVGTELGRYVIRQVEELAEHLKDEIVSENLKSKGKRLTEEEKSIFETLLRKTL